MICTRSCIVLCYISLASHLGPGDSSLVWRIWCIIHSCSFVWCGFQDVFFLLWQGKENSRLLRYAFSFKVLHLYMALCHVTFICKGCYKPVTITASLLALFVNHHREQERYLLRIQELETAVARLGEESIDRATLLESVQSDKETISRSVWPNWKLQIIVSWLEQSAFKLWLMKVVCR